MGYSHFNREERLKLRKSISILFSRGSVLRIYPFNVFYCAAPTSSTSHQVLFTSSRGRIRKAVDRNKIKRRSKESYRLHKQALKNPLKLWIGFVYTPREILSYDCIDHAMRKSMRKLNEESAKIIATHPRGVKF